LSKEKESLLQDYNALKQRFDEEYHRLAERKRVFQQELDALGRLNLKIKELVSLSILLFICPTFTAYL
jgi:DNA repair protein RAD50